MATVIENGISGYINTDPAKLVDHMQTLLADRQLGHQLGTKARQYALERFSIRRFTNDWNAALKLVTQ